MNLTAFWPALRRDYTSFEGNGPADGPKDAARYRDIIHRLDAMTTPSVMHALNRAVSLLEPGEIYLEIGCYRGSTLIGAMRGNDAAALAVDDRSNHSPDGLDNAAEFWRNVEAFGVNVLGVVRADVHQFLAAANTDTPQLLEQCAPGTAAVYCPVQVPPVGVLFVDGNHQDADDTLATLRGCVPLLAPRAVILMDDANMPKIHEAAHRWVAEEPRARLLFDRRTPHHMHHTFWNGTIAIGWEGRQ